MQLWLGAAPRAVAGVPPLRVARPCCIAYALPSPDAHLRTDQMLRHRPQCNVVATESVYANLNHGQESVRCGGRRAQHVRPAADGRG